MSESSTVRLCGRCGKPATMLCARCMGLAFCDSICQRAAWRDHKPLCVPVASDATTMVAVTGQTVLPPEPVPPLPSTSSGAAFIASKMKAGLLGDAKALEQCVRAMYDAAYSTLFSEISAASQAVTFLVAALSTQHGAASENICRLAAAALGNICCI